MPFCMVTYIIITGGLSWKGIAYPDQSPKDGCNSPFRRNA
ncbi:hypothetical protein PBI_PBS1_234 [Bacillus phage PBS1]|uniref:Uncharacterized protein n=1 Tax=Bacillus phage PBS1 TaxID=2884423 RepID=A0A223LDR4_BPPB1|nr:hypothetical protein FK780_gp213 [Bacillus phage PBS1]ASU00056.1 hypothetical protein PBI_PBS1_234 [Bacillus phage PBS1]